MAIQAVICGDNGVVLNGFLDLPATSTIGGASISSLGTITSVSANALTAGRQGTTNPAFNVDASASSSATGIVITAAAANSGAAIAVISSATNESGTIDAKGAGTLTINGTATGKVILGRFANLKAIATPVAATGAAGGVSGAAALGVANFVTVSSDGATKGVKMTTGALGDFRFILNTSSTALNLFAASGGTINGGSADVGCAIPASKRVLAACTAADTWTVFDLAAHSGAAA